MGMPDREKIINGLEQFIADFKPFCGNKSDWQQVDDALVLLKSQDKDAEIIRKCRDGKVLKHVGNGVVVLNFEWWRKMVEKCDHFKAVPSVEDLLKAQEPRVMTIGDLYGYDMGYYERKGEELVWPVLIARGGPDTDGTVGIVRKDAFEIMADCGLINQTWRIWTAYPTKEQRKAVKWDG